MRNIIFMLLALCTMLYAATFGFADTGRYEVAELTISHSSAGIKNVWDDVTLTVSLTSPTGKTYTIHGFYYSTNCWKFRFAPDELGIWSFTGSFSGATTGTGSGSFKCVTSNNPGFIRRNPKNKYGWIYSDGSPYYLFGCQDGVAAAGFTATYWELGEMTGLTMDQYLDILANQCGVNCWRLTVDAGFAPYIKIGDPTNRDANILTFR